MSFYVFKPKTENKNITQDYMTGTGKNAKAVYKLKKNQQPKSKFFFCFFAREFIVSVSFSISTTFHLRSSIILFAAIA